VKTMTRSPVVCAARSLTAIRPILDIARTAIGSREGRYELRASSPIAGRPGEIFRKFSGKLSRDRLTL